MKLSNLLANIEYTVINDGNPEITDIIYDSRKVTDGTAFVCLKGYTSTVTSMRNPLLKKAPLPL